MAAAELGPCVLPLGEAVVECISVLPHDEGEPVESKTLCEVNPWLKEVMKDGSCGTADSQAATGVDEIKQAGRTKELVKLFHDIDNAIAKAGVFHPSVVVEFLPCLFAELL